MLHDADEDEPRAKGGTWTNVTLASFDVLRKVAEGNATSFVWADEGRFKSTGSFEFNADHQDFQPLLIDKVSAQMMLKLHEALNETNQLKFQDWIGKGRGHFAHMWNLTEERVSITGFSSR